MTSMFINTPPDMICIGVMSTLRGMPLKMIGYRVNRYEFQVKMLLEQWNVYQYTTGYDLHWCNVDFAWNAPQNDWI